MIVETQKDRSAIDLAAVFFHWIAQFLHAVGRTAFISMTGSFPLKKDASCEMQEHILRPVLIFATPAADLSDCLRFRNGNYFPGNKVFRSYLQMMIPHRFVQQFKCVGRMADVAVIKLVEQCDIVQTRHQIRLPARDGKRKDPLDLLRLGYDEQYAVHLL